VDKYGRPPKKRPKTADMESKPGRTYNCPDCQYKEIDGNPCIYCPRNIENYDKK